MYLQVEKCKRLFLATRNTLSEKKKKSQKLKDSEAALQWEQFHPQKWFASEQHKNFIMVRPSHLSALRAL